jgi:hypothetical protein
LPACRNRRFAPRELERQIDDLIRKIARARDLLLVYCSFPGEVEPTNNGSERALRPAVIFGVHGDMARRPIQFKPDSKLHQRVSSANVLGQTFIDVQPIRSQGADAGASKVRVPPRLLEATMLDFRDHLEGWEMALNNRTKLGITVAIAVLAGLTSVWIAMLLLVLAVLLIASGQAPERTEAFLGRLPGGNSLLKALDQLT